MRDKFAVFILTHGRPNKVVTYSTLKKQGYTGDIYLVVDNEDEAVNDYRSKFGASVVVFDKLKISKTFDTGDNFQDRRSVVYARNACFEIAKEIGLDYFLQLDDDYTDFRYKFNSSLQYVNKLGVLNLDRLFSIILKYYKKTNALSIAIAQGGDFIGGKNGKHELGMKRKCMNTFFCSTSRPFQFIGRVNEDVNTYTCIGNRGQLFLTLPNVAINQLTTQSNGGGMTELYLKEGTYIKSFYSVMYSPSFVRVSELRDRERRIHHKVNWNSAVPKIIDPKYQRLNGRAKS